MDTTFLKDIKEYQRLYNLNVRDENHFRESNTIFGFEHQFCECFNMKYLFGLMQVVNNLNLHTLLDLIGSRLLFLMSSMNVGDIEKELEVEGKILEDMFKKNCRIYETLSRDWNEYDYGEIYCGGDDMEEYDDFDL